MKEREMEEVSIDEFADFVPEIIPPLGLDRRVIYRGLADVEWSLLPRLLRGKRLEESQYDKWEPLLSASMKAYRKEVRQFLDIEPRNELEWHALAAQHGAPSLFTTWSVDALTALWHATEPTGKDGCVYRIHPEEADFEIDEETERLPQSAQMYQADRLESVALAQESVFVAHPLPEVDTPAMPLDEIWHCTPELRIKLTKIVVPEVSKHGIRQKLSVMGKHPGSLFPGARGVGAKIDAATSAHTEHYDWVFEEL